MAALGSRWASERRLPTGVSTTGRYPHRSCRLLVAGGLAKAAAERAIADLKAKAVWRAPIVTEVAPLEKF